MKATKCIQCNKPTKKPNWNGQCTKCGTKQWGYIKSNSHDFIRALQKVIKLKSAPWNKKGYDWDDYLALLDVGCGAGNILLQTKTVIHLHKFTAYKDPEGIEISRKLAEIAKLITQDRITYGNAFHKKHHHLYKEANVIHWYRPLVEDALMEKLEKLIENTAKIGTIFMANWIASLKRLRKDPRFKIHQRGEHGVYTIYQKISA